MKGSIARIHFLALEPNGYSAWRVLAQLVGHSLAIAAGGKLDSLTRSGRRKMGILGFMISWVVLSGILVNGVWGVVDYSSGVFLVVDQRGLGNFRTVQRAIDAVPFNNMQRVLIFIRPGIYREKVTVPAGKPFIVLIGSVAERTVISWNASNRRNGGTYSSATLTVLASDFEARSLTIQNTYGYDDQAVALRVSGDRALFRGCRFLGYQDTILDDSGRHYFSNCYIEGGADFICGNGLSLYQNCHLHTIPKLNGAIAAQRRSSWNENTGFVFLNCKITGNGWVYLGRAWGPFSRVIYAYTYMENIIFPQGWHDWDDPNRARTVSYGQYKCYGPGSSSWGRVSWSHELTDAQVQSLLSIRMIDGQNWIRPLPARWRLRRAWYAARS